MEGIRPPHVDKHRAEGCVLSCAACSSRENGVRVLPVRQKNGEHGRLAGSVGAASNPPLCFQASVGDNVDDEGGIWRGAQCIQTNTHTHWRSTSPRPQGTQPASCLSFSLPGAKMNPPLRDMIDVTGYVVWAVQTILPLYKSKYKFWDYETDIRPHCLIFVSRSIQRHQTAFRKVSIIVNKDN